MTTIVEFLSKQDRPRTTNYIRTAMAIEAGDWAMKRNLNDVEQELEQLRADGRVEFVPNSVKAYSKMFGGWRLAASAPA
jgi:hypothetical protein